MFKNESEWNRVKIAYKTCNEKELEALAKDENDGVKIAVANNKNTTSKILEFLSEDKSWWVRIAVAKHKNTNPDTLYLLGIKEEIWPVKKTLLENPNTPKDLFERISNEDRNKWIAERKINFKF